MFLFVGIGTSMAQDKAAAGSDAAVKKEVSGKHACSADCAKSCCSKEGGKSTGAKKACSAEQQKQCSGHSSATKTDATESTGKESSAKPKN